MNTRLLLLVGLLLVVLLSASGFVMVDLLDIRTSPLPRPEVQAPQPGDDGRTTVAIGVVSRFAPNVIFSGYQPIMDYLNRHGTRHYELKLSTSYLDAVEDLRRGEVAASFLGAWIYAHLDTDRDLVPLAAPLNASGHSDFHAILVTRADTGIASVADLAGRSVALPSASSWSGNWLQSAGLPAVGLTAADLDTLQHFDHHQTVVWQVLRGRFDAGVVKESVAARFRREGLVVATRSGSIPGPPLVGNRHGRQDVLDEIVGLLLRLDPESDADRTVLDAWTREFSYGFTVVDADRYHEAFPRKGR